MALVAMMSVSFVSCKENKEEAPEETTEVEVETPAMEEEVVVDTMAVDTVAVEVEHTEAH